MLFQNLEIFHDLEHLGEMDLDKAIFENIYSSDKKFQEEMIKIHLIDLVGILSERYGICDLRVKEYFYLNRVLRESISESCKVYASYYKERGYFNNSDYHLKENTIFRFLSEAYGLECNLQDTIHGYYSDKISVVYGRPSSDENLEVLFEGNFPADREKALKVLERKKDRPFIIKGDEEKTTWIKGFCSPEFKEWLRRRRMEFLYN